MARMRPPVWHPTLTTAAEQGEQHLEAALEAEVEVDVEGGRLYEVNPRGSFQHSGDSLSHGDEGVEGRQSPFPPQSPFGIVPYVVLHGRHVVAESYLRDLRADQDGVALVPTEPMLQVHVLVTLGFGPNQQAAAALVDTVPARGLQIAVWKRDTRMVKLLLEYGASDDLPFLLDMAPPRPGTLFASKAGQWSREGHWCYPPAFRAAVRELLRVSHKHGGVRRRDGRLRWPFRTEELIGLLLPVMGRGSMTAWVTHGDRLPEDEGDEEAGNEAAGSEDEGQE